jgi:sugar phosphate isomerase/epimerase
MGFNIGVTSGIYSAARSEELGEVIRKLGYGLTRGATTIEVALDVPHEITYTDGRVMEQIARKQDITITLHGSLTIPMCIPERSDYRDAHDHMQKSVRSAIHCGAKYVDFHASLNIWLELMTYTSRKLTMSFCDHRGRFISGILKENEMLRKWFAKEKGASRYEYLNDILKENELNNLNLKLNERQDNILKRYFKERLPPVLRNLGLKDEIISEIVNQILIRSHAPSLRDTELEKKIDEELDRIKLKAQKEIIEDRNEETIKFVEEKLAREGKWDSEELRSQRGILDGYHIMAHHLFFNQDKMWIEMKKIYEDELEDYDLDPGKMNSLMRAWEKAEDDNDRGFKEFYYAVVGAKYLEGHLMRLIKWMDNGLVKKEIPDMNISSEEKERLKRNAKRLKIAIENPDARDPSHAGLHLLWHPKQIYVAVKVIREKLDNERVELLMDFEHLAGQGLDPITEMEKVIKVAPDFGDLTLSVHSNSPNPSHAHLPLELGDVRVYRLLWFLRKSGLGKRRDAYLIFERGGGEEPFKQSVDVLRLCARFLDRNILPKDLPEEFYGMKGRIAGDERRQLQIVRDHMYDPLKDLLEMPEEEWGMLSTAVLKKGKKPEQWKKGEFR